MPPKDARVDDFLHERVRRRIVVRHGVGHGAREREAEVLRAEEALQRFRRGARHAAVRGRIFRMRRRPHVRKPGGVGCGVRIVVGVRVLDRRDRPPEIEVIFRIEARDDGIGMHDVHQRVEPRTLDERQVVRREGLAQVADPEVIGVLRVKPRDLGLPGRALAALERTHALDLLDICGVAGTAQVRRAVRTELRRALQCKRSDARLIRRDRVRKRRRCSLIHAGAAAELIAHDVVAMIVGAEGQDAGSDLGADRDTLGLGRTVRNRGERRGQRRIEHGLLVRCQTQQNIIPRGCGGGSRRRAAGRRAGTDRIRLVAAFDRNDRVVDGGVHDRVVRVGPQRLGGEHHLRGSVPVLDDVRVSRQRGEQHGGRQQRAARAKAAPCGGEILRRHDFPLLSQVVAARDPQTAAGTLRNRSGDSTLGEGVATCLKVA